ncbi:MAG: hypothetical protein JXB05_02510 [Myxococcaceae bacterium]|nr:hypothetical protein [Myxococcaceae bacterium]
MPKPAPAPVASQDLFEVLDGTTQQDARSVVALLCTNRLSPKADGTFEVNTVPFVPPPKQGVPQNVCATQPFRTQSIAAFCSGVLVTPNRVATSAACLSRAKQFCGGDFAGAQSSVRVVFGFAMTDAATLPSSLPGADVFVPQRIVKQTTGLKNNWVLVELNRSADSRAVPLRLEKASGGTVRVIGSPHGLPAKVSQPRLMDNSAAATFTVAPSAVGQGLGTPVFSGGTSAVVGVMVDDPVFWNCSASNACCQTAPIPGRGTTATVVRSSAIAQAVCAPGSTLCGTECVTTTSDLNHCGRCGNACNLPNATATCARGGCRIAACAPGWADCDRVAANGCERQLNTTSDCSGCGQACNLPNSEELCAAGTCQVAACEPGYANCDGSPSNGCETRLGTTSNCSACGAVCNLPRAAEVCVDGACQVISCEAGFANCDAVASNGCEVQLGTTANCGACGDACELDHASEVCSAKKCKISTCEAGYADCDHVAANGCEAQLNTLTHCGACGQACNLAHASETCALGICQVLECEPGYANCDGVASNGCETQLGTTANCGACGASCGAAPNTIPFCSGGVCQSTCKAGFADCNTSPGCETAGSCAPACSPSICDDGNACTTDSCDAQGQCVHTAVSCNDNNPCTTDACNTATGCTFTSKPQGTACTDDGNACTSDVCSANGQCSHPPVICNDNNECTSDTCNSSTGCSFQPRTSGSACTDDGSLCTTDVCNSAGQCTHPNITCNDSNECTSDTCNPSSGCSFPPRTGSTCTDDGSACTTDVCNSSGQCTHPAIICNDSNECTSDTCNASSGCSFPPLTGSGCTDDGSACTADVCNSAGQCTHPAITCNDGNPCTADTCNPASGCSFPNEPSDVTCPDEGNSCTLDFCDGAGVCRHHQKVCSGNATCVNGTCTCSSPNETCGGVCTNTDTDRNNCGACGVTCSFDRFCSNGACICGPLPFLNACDSPCTPCGSPAQLEEKARGVARPLICEACAQ